MTQRDEPTTSATVRRTLGRVVRSRYLSGVPGPRAVAMRYRRYGRGFHRFWWDLSRADLPRSSPGEVTAVILCHGRPFNIDLHVRAALLAREVGTVVVSNNNEDLDLEEIVDVRHPRLVLRDDYGINANRRHLLAAEYASSTVIAPDDDTFLRPGDMDALVRRFGSDTRAPLSVQGQRWDGSRWTNLLLAPPEQRVDVANRVYVYSRAQAEQALSLARDLDMAPGTSAFATEPVDDVLLSFAGRDHPLVVDVDFLNCATASDAAVATYRRTGFAPVRAELIRELRARLGWGGAPPPLGAQR